jgi:hypothetical protein
VVTQSLVSRLRLVRRGSIPGRDREGIFLFATASTPALGQAQPPIKWVLAILFSGVKRPGRETDHFCLVPKLRMRGAIPPLTQRLHVVRLSYARDTSLRSVAYLSTGANLLTFLFFGDGGGRNKKGGLCHFVITDFRKFIWQSWRNLGSRRFETVTLGRQPVVAALLRTSAETDFLNF